MGRFHRGGFADEGGAGIDWQAGPPEFCDCCQSSPTTVAMIEVSKVGKKRVGPASLFATKDSHDNFLTDSLDKSRWKLSGEFTFVRWLAWCGNCYLQRVGRMRPVRTITGPAKDSLHRQRQIPQADPQAYVDRIAS